MTELDAEHIAALCRGFLESRVMLTAVELDLFSRLAGRWLTAEGLAESNQWDVRALRILLDALVVMGLLNKRGDSYSTTRLTAEYLSRDGAFTILDKARHAVDLWDELSKLTARVTADGVAPTRDPVRAFIGTMNLLTPRFAPGIAALVRPEQARRFLDAGGGSAAYTMAFLTRDRSLEAVLFNRPEVLAICAEYLRESEFEDQVKLVAGDPMKDELPGDMGMVFLSAVSHTLPMDQVSDLLGRCYRALVPGGRVVICDYIMSADRLQPRVGTLHAVATLVSTQAGEPHTFLELRAALASAGFVDTRLLQDGEHMNAIVEAYRPRG